MNASQQVPKKNELKHKQKNQSQQKHEQKNESDQGRYVVYDTKTNKRLYNVGPKADNIINKAGLIVAQHYKYLRCNRHALSDVFSIAGGSRDKVFRWLLNHSNHSNNVILCSQRKLAKKIGVGFSTIKRIVHQLKAKNLAKTKHGSLIISPRLFFYGSDEMFLIALRRYNKI